MIIGSLEVNKNLPRAAMFILFWNRNATIRLWHLNPKLCLTSFKFKFFFVKLNYGFKKHWQKCWISTGMSCSLSVLIVIIHSYEADAIPQNFFKIHGSNLNRNSIWRWKYNCRSEDTRNDAVVKNDLLVGMILFLTFCILS